MELKEAVARYLEAVGFYGEPMPLDRFGLPAAEVEALLSSWEEDYHFSHHFELLPSSWMTSGAPAYHINGAMYTAIVFRESIQDVLH